MMKKKLRSTVEHYIYENHYEIRRNSKVIPIKLCKTLLQNISPLISHVERFQYRDRTCIRKTFEHYSEGKYYILFSLVAHLVEHCRISMRYSRKLLHTDRISKGSLK